MRKSGAPEDNNWQNVDKRNNSSKRDTRNNDAAQRDQRSEKNRETEIERQPNPVYGSNYGPQMPGPQMQQWGPPPRSMVAQWGPPPPGWAAYPPGNWGSQFAQQKTQALLPPFYALPRGTTLGLGLWVPRVDRTWLRLGNLIEGSGTGLLLLPVGTGKIQ